MLVRSRQSNTEARISEIRKASICVALWEKELLPESLRHFSAPSEKALQVAYLAESRSQPTTDPSNMVRTTNAQGTLVLQRRSRKGVSIRSPPNGRETHGESPSPNGVLTFRLFKGVYRV